MRLLLLVVIMEIQQVAAVGGMAPKSTDAVIVVGGGLAGLSASIEALNNGASKVYIIDKEKDLGGNSAKATSGISACGTKIQKDQGIEDNADKFYLDTMNAGDRENNPSLVDVLVHNSADAVQFLIDHGVNLSAINLCGGHAVPRTHWLASPKEGKPLPVGVAIIRALKQFLLDYKEKNPEKLIILTQTKVVGLVTWNDYITGVRYHNESGLIDELNGKAVILTTGGFSADKEESSLLRQYASNVYDLPTTNGAFASGDGVKMASAMGAALEGMEHVQIHPTAFIDPKNPSAGTKFLAAEALRGKGALMVNHKGERFGNELGRRDYLTRLINEKCAKDVEAGNVPVAFMILNDEVADEFGRPSFNFYANIKGFFQKFDNADALADAYKFDRASFEKSLVSHNSFYNKAKEEAKVRDEFDKHVFPVEFHLDKPIYVARMTPAIHYTMGGLKIDRHAFVFSDFMQKPFRGLLAAGEVSGGVHGRNRLAGNSLLECVVFGRIAGRSAAQVNYSSKEEL